VQALHAAGIGVILDVVYNHTYFAKESVFNQTVPGYFYRQKPDGTFANASGCGNEMATERHMVRKYIIDSMKYWAEEYHIDGFRFDLMGIYDLETMKSIRLELPGLLLYGEAWAAAGSPMPEEHRAMKANMIHLPGMAAFNDDFRDALKGNHSSKKKKGFVSGLDLREEGVKFGVVAAVHHPQIVYDYVETSVKAWAGRPDQCINYASCHDNYTLWDKLKLSSPRASDEEMRKMMKLAGALIITSQGIPFPHSGMEFCRTKNGNPNSYKSPDAVNQIDWSRKKTFHDVFEYYKNLIRLRKNHPAFRMTGAFQIQKNIHFCTEYKPGMVGYCIDGAVTDDPWKTITLIFNGNKKRVTLPLPEGKYRIMVNGDTFHHENQGNIVSEEVKVDAISMMILVQTAD